MEVRYKNIRGTIGVCNRDGVQLLQFNFYCYSVESLNSIQWALSTSLIIVQIPQNHRQKNVWLSL